MSTVEFHDQRRLLLIERDEAIIERDAARAEVKRLTRCLRRANAGTLHFEQAWNLAMDERDAAIAEVARLRRYEQCIVCDKPLVNDDCVEHGGAGVSARKQLRDLSQEALSWQRRETEAIAQRDATRAALTEACDMLAIARLGNSPPLREQADVIRTRGGVMSPFIEGKNDR